MMYPESHTHSPDATLAIWAPRYPCRRANELVRNASEATVAQP